MDNLLYTHHFFGNKFFSKNSCWKNRWILPICTDKIDREFYLRSRFTIRWTSGIIFHAFNSASVIANANVKKDGGRYRLVHCVPIWKLNANFEHSNSIQSFIPLLLCYPRCLTNKHLVHQGFRLQFKISSIITSVSYKIQW